MARETAAERKNREAMAVIAEYARVKAEYPVRLMSLMAEYEYIPGFTFKKDDERNVDHDPATCFLFSIDNAKSFAYRLPAEMVEWNNYYDLESAEQEVKEYFNNLAEEERKYNVKVAAMAKLTAEERELLGLN